MSTHFTVRDDRVHVVSGELELSLNREAAVEWRAGLDRAIAELEQARWRTLEAKVAKKRARTKTS
jgi:hypothetical protein